MASATNAYGDAVDPAEAVRRKVSAQYQQGVGDPVTGLDTQGTPQADPVAAAPFTPSPTAATGSAGPTGNSAYDAFLTANGGTTAADQPTRIGDTITARHGGVVDVATGNQTVGQQSIPPPAAQVAAAPPATPSPNGVPLTPTPNPFLDSIRQLILQRLKEASAPVDPNAPQIQATVNAARDEATRAATAERGQLAERLYAQRGGGLQTDALTRQIQQSGERNATSLATLRANIITNVYNQKLSELKDELQLAMASGDAESARAVQLQLAALQAQIQREGIGANLAIAGQNFNNVTVGAGA